MSQTLDNVAKLPSPTVSYSTLKHAGTGPLKGISAELEACMATRRVVGTARLARSGLTGNLSLKRADRSLCASGRVDYRVVADSLAGDAATLSASGLEAWAGASFCSRMGPTARLEVKSKEVTSGSTPLARLLGDGGFMRLTVPPNPLRRPVRADVEARLISAQALGDRATAGATLCLSASVLGRGAPIKRPIVGIRVELDAL